MSETSGEPSDKGAVRLARVRCSSEKGSWLCSAHNPEHRRSSEHIDAGGCLLILAFWLALAVLRGRWLLVLWLFVPLCFLLASLVCGLVPWPSSLLG